MTTKLANDLGHFKCMNHILEFQTTAIELRAVEISAPSGNFLQASCGVPTWLTLTVGSVYTAEGASVIDVDITDPEGSTLDWQAEDNNDGSYTIAYVPILPGYHRLSVKVFIHLYTLL